MKKIAFVLLAASSLIGAPSFAQDRESRCGWIENDMPSGMTLTDKDGNWTIATMTYAADGFDEHMPEVNAQEACGCLDVEVDKASKRVTRLFGGKVIQKKVCASDPSLR
ncbi:DUF4087 domain-containing protein [Bordetella hinzii]|uniref:DUF4087 domain-containing protein n=1 Tax=Bordetella hinzii TaxID=103855 RepID=UPI0039FCFC6C